MNPEQQPKLTDLQSKLSSILDWVEQTAKSAEQFAVEQTPLYIQELLAWNFWSSLFFFIIGAAFWVLALSRVKFVSSYDYVKDPLPAVAIMSIITLIVGPLVGSVVIGSNLEWLQIWVAPRVWLVEYVASKL